METNVRYQLWMVISNISRSRDRGRAAGLRRGGSSCYWERLDGLQDTSWIWGSGSFEAHLSRIPAEPVDNDTQLDSYTVHMASAHIASVAA
jgi:hypothetical protein